MNKLLCNEVKNKSNNFKPRNIEFKKYKIEKRVLERLRSIKKLNTKKKFELPNIEITYFDEGSDYNDYKRLMHTLAYQFHFNTYQYLTYIENEIQHYFSRGKEIPADLIDEWHDIKRYINTEELNTEVANLKPSSSPTDMVNHPSHYNRSSIECIDALNAMVEPYEDPIAAVLSWQVCKYVWRHPYKDKPLEDLKKAQFYLNKLIEHYEGENK